LYVPAHLQDAGNRQQTLMNNRRALIALERQTLKAPAWKMGWRLRLSIQRFSAFNAIAI
jgi:hypothetical protein